MLAPNPDEAAMRQFAAAIARDAPEAGPAWPLELLGAGFYSLAVRTAGGAVFRIPRVEEAAGRHAAEGTLLRAIAGRLPYAVPVPRWEVGPGPGMPWGATGYDALPGVVPDGNTSTEGLGKTVGTALAALHALPIEEVGAVAVDRRPGRVASWRRLQAASMPVLADLLPAEEHATVDAWWRTLFADSRMDRFTPVLAHADPWRENLLVDPASGRLTALLDWEWAGIDDPAIDFSMNHYYPAAYHAAFVRAYAAAGGRVDVDLLHRAQRLIEVREFFGIAWAIRYDDRAELADGVAKLRESAILNADAPLLCRCGGHGRQAAV